MKIKLSFLYLFVIIFAYNTYSQTKVQNLYEAKRYKKCLRLCDNNIKKNINKLPSILYKNLVLVETYDNEDILKLYHQPIYEALKGIQKIEKNKLRKPTDKFYFANKERVNSIVDNSLIVADTFFNRGDIKRALKIYKKLYAIFPNEKLYMFKIAKANDFNTSIILQKNRGITEEDYYNSIYEIVTESIKYLNNDSEKEIKDALEKIYLQENCDLEVTSILLVFLKENYASCDKIQELLTKFQRKYWQIDLLIRVNEKRKSGYTCGNDIMKQKPPLVLNNCLITTSQKYAELMYNKRHFSHISPNGKSPWKRAREEGCYANAENIAMGSSTVSGVLNQWLNSTGHCKNIMKSHKYMGIGEAGTYWVQMFK